MRFFDDFCAFAMTDGRVCVIKLSNGEIVDR